MTVKSIKIGKKQFFGWLCTGENGTVYVKVTNVLGNTLFNTANHKTEKEAYHEAKHLLILDQRR